MPSIRDLARIPNPEVALPNGKHEMFAQMKAAGRSNRDAARAAGYSAEGSAPGAGVLVAPGVRERIEYLQRVKVAVAEGQREATTNIIRDGFKLEHVTLEVLVGEAWINMQTSREQGDLKESNASIKLIADLMGLGRAPKDPNKGGSNGAPSIAGRTVNVQINNQGPDRLPDAPGKLLEAWSEDPAAGAAALAHAVSDERSGETAGSDVGGIADDFGDLPEPPARDGT